MIVDFQHHHVPRKLAELQGFDLSGRVEVKEGSRPKVTLHRRVFDLDVQLADMDEAGIDVAALSCFSAWDAPLDQCQVANDELARVQQDSGGRFVGLANIPAHIPEEGEKELVRAIAELGLKGLGVTSQIKGKPLDSPDFFGIYERAVELDVPIWVHPVMAPVGYLLAEDHDLGRILVREFDLCLTAVRLVAGGVLERFPGIKFVIGHFGGGIAAIRERIEKRDHRFDRPLARPFAEYFDLLYFDMAGFEGGRLALQTALAGMKTRQLVFATDYPQDFTGVSTSASGTPTMKSYINAVREQLGPEESDLVLGGTAARLLHL